MKHTNYGSMKKAQFIELVGLIPETTQDALMAARENGIHFGRAKQHFVAWFGSGNGKLKPMHYNLID